MNFYFAIDSDKPENKIVAKIIDGKKNNILSLVRLDNITNKQRDKIEDMLERIIPTLNDIDKLLLENIKDNILNLIVPDNPNDAILYQHVVRLIYGNSGKDIRLTDQNIKPLFNINKERTVFYISGMSGCGKSTLTGELIDNYHKIYPKNKIYIISNKEEDKAIDRDYTIRILLNTELLDYKLNLNILKNSLVIYDDIDCIPDKKIENEIIRIKDLILQQGRSYHIDFVYISHLIVNYSKTKLILTECDNCIIFPQFTTFNALKGLLERYYGFSTDEIKRLQYLPSRWVMITKNPISVIYEKGCYLLK